MDKDGKPIPVMDAATGKQQVEVVKGDDGREMEVPVWAEDTYELSPLDADDFGLMEQHILAQRVAPEGALKPLLGILDPVQQEMLLRIAYKDLKAGYNRVSKHELGDWVDTTEGTIFTFWLIIKKKQPQFDTLEKARVLYNQMSREAQEEMKRRRDLASGIDTLGNSTGLTRTTKTTPGTNGTPSTSPSPGVASSVA